MAKATVVKPDPNRWFILALMALAQFMVVLDVSIVNIALPSIFKDLHFAADNLQWVITAYSITFGGFLLFGGRVADLFGRRKALITSVTIFALASLACGLARNSTMLIITRIIQGMSGGFMSPAALSVVISEFKEGKERNKAMGVWGGVAAGGAAAGVLLGGIFTQYLGWRWNFFINVPIGLFVAVMAYRVLPHKIDKKVRVKLDTLGAILATSGLMILVYAVSEAPTKGWTSHSTIAYFGASIALLALFIFNETKTDHPLLPLRLFKIRNTVGAYLTMFSAACTLFSMFYFISLYAQQILNYSPVRSGLSFIPVTLIIGVMSAVTSVLVGKFGYKYPLMLGMLVLAFGLFQLGHIPVDGTYWTNVFPGVATVAFGMGLTFVSVTLAATSGIPVTLSGIASGMLTTTQQIGGAIGLSVLAAVEAASITRSIRHLLSTSLVTRRIAEVNGFHSAYHVAIFIALFAFLVATFMLHNQHGKLSNGEVATI